MIGKGLEQNGPLGLYLHVPFCRGLCPYCSFYSVASSREAMELWLDSILKELELLEPLVACQVVTSIYIGGGTPSALPPEIWKPLLCKLKKLPMAPSLEYTVEANPESLTESLLTLWASQGVNRISLGVQSLDEKVLRRAGRRHDASQALAALALAQSAGLRCSCDLMFGLPDQTFRSWSHSLRGLVDAGATHLSIYQLTIDPGCAWSRRPPDNRLEGYSFYRAAQWYLPRRGLKQYEIASFATEGDESRHNSAYWKNQNVLGLGPSAWGLWQGRRYANWQELSRWSQSLKEGRCPVASWEKLKGGDLASERAILALRTSEGIDAVAFQREFGSVVYDDLCRRLSAIPARLLHRQGDRLALSPEGMRVGNSIWSELLSLGVS